MIVFGKKTQVCGFAANDRIDSVVNNVFRVPGRLNSTWSGNLVDMMRARKYLEIIEEEDLMTNALDVGHYALGLIKDMCRQHPVLTSNPRGKGLMIAFDLVNSDACARFKNLMYERGVIIISAGTNTIRLRPMLDVNKSVIDKVVNTMDKCLRML
jgi:L-lysine 6-transaminase